MHTPVLLNEMLEVLNPKPNENFIDCTLGGAGHALAILEKTAPKGKVLGIDQDPEALALCKEKGQGRLIIKQGNFRNVDILAKESQLTRIAGILFDIGFSSNQLESNRGFSFKTSSPLDMRMDPTGPLTAEKIINFWSKFDIEKILKEYGEEQFAKEIAESLIQERKIKQITKTDQLATIVANAVPAWYKKQKIHPATKTFQALRIAVNDELNALKEALPKAKTLLGPNGRLAVISFHSLEDRIIKEFFKNSPDIKTITKKPITATNKELAKNPRSRSAKLRAGIKIS